MKAAVLTSFGDPDAVIVTELPEPPLNAGDVRVAIEAASLGSWDALAAKGNFTALGGQATFPQQIGRDFAGTIQAAGPGAGGLAAGDRVLGFIAQPWMGAGAVAETITLPAALLTLIPGRLDSITAATLPVALLTADIALASAEITRGSTVLILGAAGAVGSFATQLAARAGVTIAASVSPKSFDDATALGATVIIDRDADVAGETIAAIGTVDAIIDLVGPTAWPSVIGALKEGGRFVTTIPGGLPDLPADATGITVGVQPNPGRLAELVQLVADGHVTAFVGDRLKLDKTAEGMRLAATAGRHRVVLLP
jgi:NADPH:quinone reductase-like Zn-dependent oxidoreductase